MVASASSGGIFPQLAQNILQQGGAAVGAAFDENFDCVLTLIQDIADLPKLLQAKYVQAKTPPEIFQQALSVLQADRPLLFCGTPCQIAAFRSFCGSMYYPQLLCAELICHGVPSPAVWRSYLRFVIPQVGAPLKSVAFRDKTHGWHKFALKITGSSGESCQIHKQSPYMQLFLNELISRKSCTECVFKGGSSGADLSLGDFWKLGRIAPELDNSTGASMVITHTEQGLKKLKECDLAALQEFPMEVVKISNRAYWQSIQPHALRDKYFAGFIHDSQQWIAPEPYLSKKRKNFLQKLLALLKK